MQLYALNRENELVAAQSAKSKTNYFCLECDGIVRTRRGSLRKAHFYHLNHITKCSQHKKSLTHIAIQEYLSQLLPNALMERRFPAIQRIADVAWLDQKIVFEIQCSPIDPEEIHSRNRDYQSQGFATVWILHDKRYNKWRHSLAEKALLGSPRYFTNINQHGKGMIYDQFEIIQNGLRSVRFSPLEIEIGRPYWKPNLGFQGDFYCHEIATTNYFLMAQREKEKRLAKPLLLMRFLRYISEGYMNWLDRRLERTAINHDI